MISAEPFPLFHPSDARCAFERDEVTRRFAQLVNLASGSRVLELACGRRGSAGLLIARDLGCDVVAADTDEKELALLQARIKSQALTDRVTVRKVDYGRLPFGDGEFDGILVQGKVILSLDQAVRTLRRYLAARGRLCLTYPAKIGRYPSRVALDFWEKRLGEALRLPQDLLRVLELAGYEPESVETMSDAELAEYYRGVEQQLATLPKEHEARAQGLKEEIELFRAHAGRCGVSYALVTGRRKEPGERPPASRDRG